jgi:hypothetical protein
MCNVPGQTPNGRRARTHDTESERARGATADARAAEAERRDSDTAQHECTTPVRFTSRARVLERSVHE